MGRKLLNAATTASEQNTLGIYYIQDDEVYGQSNQRNGSYGWINKHGGSGQNYYNNNTNQTGYTIKKADSYLRVRFTATGDHGTNWRANSFLLQYTTNNWSNTTNIGGFGMTMYNGPHHNYGNSGCYERIWLHGSSVGTVYKFGIADSTNSNGNTKTYNNVNSGGDSVNGTENDYGLVYAMNIRVEEIEAAEVSQFSSQNTFASGG